MSEQEFETYLDLLARMLRLNPQQRDAIAQELRDHMEDRLDELIDAGMDREQAVRAALDEFGDASALAHDFTDIAHTRRRRRIMKASLGTVAACAAIVLTTAYLLPENRTGVPAPSSAVAEQNAEAPADDSTASIKEKLNAIVSVEFEANRLSDVLAYFRDAADLNIFADWRLFADTWEITPETVVSLSLNDVPVETSLKLALRAAHPELTYIVHNGVVVVTTVHAAATFIEDSDMKMRVIDVSQWAGNPAALLPDPAKAQPTGPRGRGPVGGGMYGPGMDPYGAPPSSPIAATPGDKATELAAALTRLLNASAQRGQRFSIEGYDGLLLVYADDATQQRVSVLLNEIEHAVQNRNDRKAGAAQYDAQRRQAAAQLETPRGEATKTMEDRQASSLRKMQETQIQLKAAEQASTRSNDNETRGD